MSVFYLGANVIAQFATNVELVDDPDTGKLIFTPSGYRFRLDKAPDSGPAAMYFIDLDRSDPHLRRWGDGSQITESIITVDVMYARPGGSLGGGDRLSVMRNAHDDLQRMADVCENPANYNSSVTGIREIRYQGTRRVADLGKSEVWQVRFWCQWQSDLATTPVVDLTEGRLIVDGISSGTTQLIAISTNSLESGSSAWSIAEWEEFVLDKTDTQTPDGTTIVAAIGGGNWLLRTTSSDTSSAVGWDAGRWAEIVTLLGTQVDDYQWSDFLNPNEVDLTMGPNFAEYIDLTGGVLGLPGGASSGTGYIYLAGEAYTGGKFAVINNPKTESWAVVSRTKFTGVPSGSATIWLLAMAGGPGGTGSMTAVQIIGSLSTTVCKLILNTAGSIGTTATAVDSSAVGTLGSGIVIGTYYNFMLAFNAITGTVGFYVNGVLAASTTTLTNMPTQKSEPAIVVASAARDLLEVDALMCAFKRTT